jgi:hypothetical protein
MRHLGSAHAVNNPATRWSVDVPKNIFFIFIYKNNDLPLNSGRWHWILRPRMMTIANASPQEAGWRLA